MSIRLFKGFLYSAVVIILLFSMALDGGYFARFLLLAYLCATAFIVCFRRYRLKLHALTDDMKQPGAKDTLYGIVAALLVALASLVIYTLVTTQ